MLRVMLLTLVCSLGVWLLAFWLLGSHFVFHKSHMGDVSVPSQLVLCHNPIQLHSFTVAVRQFINTKNAK